ncbi:hypothetical protein ACEZCY_08160 [Streptacidiphilus sp. N1-12]|uniref:ATP-binding protein n=2 Tax=Streptacidiphilus alkalitolerans TaxID=3342712 RepID=A0ABV6VFF5_9ACTN
MTTPGPGGPFPAGRWKAAAEFRAVLATSADDTNLHLTGAPGTGRSTLLNWLFRLSDQQPSAGSGSGPVFHAALGARGRGADGLAAALGEQLGYDVATPGELLSVLAVDPRPVCLAVSELDESDPVGTRTSARVLTELLVPLAALPRVRLVTEGSREWLGLLPPGRVIDLDLPFWTDWDAFESFVQALCESAAEVLAPPEAARAVRGGGASAAAFVRSVAEAAFPNFLLAQVLVLALLGPTAPLAADTRPLPTGLDRAVELLVERWSRTAPAVADALYGLALAGPYGFDADSWRLGTRAATGRRLPPDGPEEVLEQTFCLVKAEEAEDAEGPEGFAGTSYRLRHPAIAEALLTARGPGAEQRARTALTYGLAGAVPVGADGTGALRPNWPELPPAQLSQLLRQAAAAQRLAPLLPDPGLLLQADLDTLRAAADGSVEPAAVALRPVLELMHPGSRPQAAQLQVAAARQGLSALAGATGRAFPELAFRAGGQAGTVPPAAQDGTLLLEKGRLRVLGPGPVTAWELSDPPCLAAKAADLDGEAAVLVATGGPLLQIRSREEGRPLRPAVALPEAATAVELLLGGPGAAVLCAAGDLLWVTRLRDAAVPARLRLGRNITAITASVVDGEHVVDVTMGDDTVRLVVDPRALSTAGAFRGEQS